MIYTQKCAIDGKIACKMTNERTKTQSRKNAKLNTNKSTNINELNK